jgi:hypothetical protein
MSLDDRCQFAYTFCSESGIQSSIQFSHNCPVLHFPVLEIPGTHKHAVDTGQEADSDVHRVWAGNLPLLHVAAWFVHLTTTSPVAVITGV